MQRLLGAEYDSEIVFTSCGTEADSTAILSALKAQPGCALARMSGSGATCFGLFATEAPALAAMSALRAARPNWWVAAAPAMGQAATAAVA